jgi:hypothetical protein
MSLWSYAVSGDWYKKPGCDLRLLYQTSIRSGGFDRVGSEQLWMAAACGVALS